VNRTKTLRLASVLPIIFGIAACSAQAPADEAEAPTGTAESPAAIDSSLAVDDADPVAAETTKATGWCSAKEPVIFSCQLKNRKTISVCGAESGAGESKAQYRFGSPGKSPELVWPEAASKDRLTFASVPYSGGGEAQLSFSRGDVTYIVYSRMVRTNFKAGEPNNPEMTDGIMVLKGRKMASDLVCADPDVVPVDYDLASEYAYQSDEAFVIPGE
tara:strand:- start:49583 stop:50230 length:648 start_codon:yes stop_codon:yes gene_type:complete